MKRGKILLLGCLALVVLGAIYGARLIHRGFSTTEEPSGIEKLLARAVRNLSIPSRARKETNPFTGDSGKPGRSSRSFPRALRRLSRYRRLRRDPGRAQSLS